jgi:lipopolysaccharide heptosyltransferase I
LPLVLKILILKPSSLGDVVQALPMLRLIKLHLPQSEIFWWIDAKLKSLLEGDPDLTGLFTFERKRWASLIHWPEIWASIRAMRAQRFDWVVDLQGLARSGAFAWLANGALTIGLDDAREGARGFYDVAVPRLSRETHAVDWYLSVLPRLGVPVHWQFQWLPERPEITAKVREKWKVNASRWLVLLPGARWENKRWPAEYFAESVKRLTATDSELRFAILGSVEDGASARQIAAACPQRCLDLSGQTSLQEMVEWIRQCELVVTNDTGPMHVAAALGKPVIAIFGPTNPNRTGPYWQKERAIQLRDLPCVPCLKDYCSYVKPYECLRAITPTKVCEAVQAQLNFKHAVEVKPHASPLAS